MVRRKVPFRYLLEACSYIFDSALRMTGGPGPPVSPTLAYQMGVKDETEPRLLGTTPAAEGGAARSGEGGSAWGTPGGAQEAWEAFNRQMDARDKQVSEAVAAAAAAASSEAGTGVRERERELPIAMLEVLKVSLSLLRRLSGRNLTVAGPFASTMQMWPVGHPQVRVLDIFVVGIVF